MQAKPVQELHPLQRYGSLPGSIGVILVHKGYLMFIDTGDPLVCNGYPVGILSQVPDHMLRFTKGRFAKDHPWFVPCGIKQEMVSFRLSRFSEVPLDTVGHHCPENQAELLDRVEKLSCGADVLQVPGNRFANGRDYAMDLGETYDPIECFFCVYA
jgi:hypothetical protein